MLWLQNAAFMQRTFHMRRESNSPQGKRKIIEREYISKNV